MSKDAIVIGLGAMGAAVLYQIAKQGMDVVGVDRHHLPHDLASSHGETRITRRAVGEGDQYIPLVSRSHAIWRDLERESGQTLFNPCGFLMMAPPNLASSSQRRPDMVRRTLDVAERHGIPHELLGASDISSRFPAFNLKGDERGYFEPGGGMLYSERCMATQLRRARELGAEIIQGCEVRAVERNGPVSVLTTQDGTMSARTVIVCAGPWTGKLLGSPLDRLLTPYRQVLHWFPVEDETLYEPGRFPAYNWRHGPAAGDYFYGFPALDSAGVIKLAAEQYDVPGDPETMRREVSAEERASAHARHARGRLKGALLEGSRSSVCAYTVTPDSDFVIDRHPGDDRMIVVSPCSGHGFKHSAAIGEAVAQMVRDGRSEIDLAAFKLDRLR